MLLKFSASYADLHLFTPNSAPLPHPEAVNSLENSNLFAHSRRVLRYNE